MKLSIAMATFNGAKYINDQLNSFSDQTIRPDELIICDDKSEDNTVNIIEKFVENAPFQVKLFQNEIRMGYGKNFGKAMSLCSGDIVFLSDQDDVWFSSKIERMKSVIKKNPDHYVFYNDSEFANENLNPSGITRLSQMKKLKKDVNNFLQGSCSVIRRKFLKYILPIPNAVEAHDTWLGWLARYLDVKYIHDETLQLYRQHGSNISNNKLNELYRQNKYSIMIKSLSSESLLSNLKSKSEFISLCTQRLNDIRIGNDGLLDNELVNSSIEICNYEKELFDKRINLKQQSSINRMYSAINFLKTGGYSYFNGFYSFMKDILFNQY